jgi:hypothetical protein
MMPISRACLRDFFANGALMVGSAHFAVQLISTFDLNSVLPVAARTYWCQGYHAYFRMDLIMVAPARYSVTWHRLCLLAKLGYVMAHA